jgi:hypothetical protein
LQFAFFPCSDHAPTRTLRSTDWLEFPFPLLHSTRNAQCFWGRDRPRGTFVNYQCCLLRCVTYANFAKALPPKLRPHQANTAVANTAVANTVPSDPAPTWERRVIRPRILQPAFCRECGNLVSQYMCSKATVCQSISAQLLMTRCIAKPQSSSWKVLPVVTYLGIFKEKARGCRHQLKKKFRAIGWRFNSAASDLTPYNDEICDITKRCPGPHVGDRSNYSTRSN